jgi:hypothetical protein
VLDYLRTLTGGTPPVVPCDEWCAKCGRHRACQRGGPCEACLSERLLRRQEREGATTGGSSSPAAYEDREDLAVRSAYVDPRRRYSRETGRPFVRPATWRRRFKHD